MEKNKKVVNKNKGKGPNYYKGKNNNNSKNKVNNKKKSPVINSKEEREEVVLNDEAVEELEKFKFYENTMAINLEGHIDINDDIAEDYADEPVMIEETLEDMREEQEEVLEEVTDNLVESVDVTELSDVEVQEEVVEVPVEEVQYEDIIVPEDNVSVEVVDDEEFEDTEVLEIDEIKYSEENTHEDAIPEIVEEVKEEVVEDVTEMPVQEEIQPVVEAPAQEVVQPVVEQPVQQPVQQVSQPAINNSTVNVNAGDVNPSGPRYYNFETRIIFMVLVSIVAFAISAVFIYQAVNYTDVEDVVYNEISTINYSACYIDNDYYHGECLGEDMQYISTLTKNVPVTFNYNLAYSSDVDYDIEYYVLGKTIIYDRDDATLVLYRDDKILKERTSIKGTGTNARISTKLDIPFKERNDYVNGYKSKYALNALASYEVVLYADDGNGPREVASITIPLSTQTFNITEETVLKENQSMTMKKVGLDSVNTVFGLIGIAFFVGGIIVVIRLIVLVYKVINGPTSTYEKKLNQILAEYDRVIVMSRSEYDIDPNKQFIKVDSFYELLDARDTLEKPIIYEKVNSVKSFFYVEDNERIYRYAMKESDFEKK